jgi:hypothetical protein
VRVGERLDDGTPVYVDKKLLRERWWREGVKVNKLDGFRAPSLDEALLARARTAVVISRPRERRSRRVARTVGSRGDPHRSSDDDEPADALIVIAALGGRR